MVKLSGKWSIAWLRLCGLFDMVAQRGRLKQAGWETSRHHDENRRSIRLSCRLSYVLKDVVPQDLLPAICDLPWAGTWRLVLLRPGAS